MEKTWLIHRYKFLCTPASQIFAAWLPYPSSDLKQFIQYLTFGYSMHKQMSSSVSCKYLSLSLKSPPSEVVWDITSLWQESTPNHSSGQKCFRKTLLPTRLSWHSPCLEASKLKDLAFMEVTDCRELVWNLNLSSVSCHSANLLLHINKVCHLIRSSMVLAL